jgi:hypothetical protein
MGRLRLSSFLLCFRLFIYVHVCCPDRPDASVIIGNVGIYLFVGLGLSRSSLNYIFVLDPTKVTCVVNLTIFILESRLKESEAIVNLTFVKCVYC